MIRLLNWLTGNNIMLTIITYIIKHNYNWLFCKRMRFMKYTNETPIIITNIVINPSVLSGNSFKERKRWLIIRMIYVFKIHSIRFLAHAQPVFVFLTCVFYILSTCLFMCYNSPFIYFLYNMYYVTSCNKIWRTDKTVDIIM